MSAAPSAVSFVDAPALAKLAAEHADHLLGILSYGERGHGVLRPEIPQAWTGLPVLDGVRQFEIWASPDPVTALSHRGMRLAKTEEVLFGAIEFDVGSVGTFQEQAYQQYVRILATLDECGYSHLLRIWHYLPQIHLDEAGLERYKCFSVARHEAFVHSGRDIARDAPAASALGRPEGSIVIAFLAGRRRGTPIENPRQMSAYRYPAQHGPRGPTFARAAYVSWAEQEQLYISGTASIVGHESQHAGDLNGQAEETIRNLRTMLDEAHRRVPLTARQWQRLLFKVYLRPGVAQGPVLERLRENFGDEPDVLVLEAEICRRELLLEIEAVALRARA